MSLSISNIVDVQLNNVPKSATRRGFGIVALFTPETGTVFNDASTRYIYVNDQHEVEQLFGTHSQTAKAALPFFAQRPRAKQLVICRWQKNPATIDATRNRLSGAVLSNTLEEFKQISNGHFALTVGETEKTITGLNLSGCTNFSTVATKINEKLTASNIGATVVFDETGHRFILTSNTSGKHPSTTISYAYKAEQQEGEYIGAMLKFENGQASQHLGHNQVALKAESVDQALFNMTEVNNSWYGLTFADQLDDSQIETVAKYAQSHSKLFGVNVIREEQLAWRETNVFKRLADAGLDHTLAIYDKDDMYACSSALARLLSMNFAANNSTITLKFKTQPTITADQITLTEFNQAKRLGINVYTYFDDVPMIAEGTVIGGKFADEIVILDWFVDACQKELFARLYKSPTKIPLTDRGQAILIACVEKVCEEGINNGAFAPGVWTGDSFGTLNSGDMLEKGYYVWSAPTATLSDSDREARKTTPIQVALKLAGAIHSVDVLVNFNR